MTGKPKRYQPAEVQSALAETERLTFTPHSQIVLAAEVLALRRLILRVAADLDTEADTIVGALAADVLTKDGNHG